MNNNDRPKSLFEHIIDLREVFVKSAFAILIGMTLSYIFIDEIFKFLSHPLKDQKLIYTSVSEIFSTHLRIAFYSALVICFPYIMWQIWRFIRPGLFENETKTAIRIMFISPILFAIGASFAFFIVVPNIFEMFIMANQNIAEFMPKTSENISFIILLMLSFGLSFQMPLVVFFLDRLNILKVQTLQKLWREVILAIVIISAIITPPDAFSMAFLAVPLIFLYIISLFFCKFIRG